MSTEEYYSNPKILRRMDEGPLGSYIDLFADRLHKEGHCRQSVWRNLRVVCDFSHWLVVFSDPLPPIPGQMDYLVGGGHSDHPLPTERLVPAR